MLIVRTPKIDYSKVRAHWAPHREFAQDRNATSTIPSQVEPYLIRVMARAKAALPESEAALKQEIDLFIAQEAQHFQQHNGFNKMLIENGYPKLAAFEGELRATYVDFLANKSLKFNLAYSEGFETLGPPAAKMWFEESDDFLAGADPEAVALWKWHMAEEFEHRHVCHRVFMALYGRTLWGRIWNGWLFRCYGVFRAMSHLGGHALKVRAYLLDIDRAGFSEAERAASERRLREVDAQKKRSFLSAMMMAISPFYDPAKKKPPRALFEYLREFESGGAWAA